MKSGRLNVRGRNGFYTWFRLTLNSNFYNIDHPNLPEVKESDIVSVAEFFLLDAERKRKNIGYTACNRYALLAPGQAAFGVQDGFSGKLNRLFDDNADLYHSFEANRNGLAPTPDDPSTHIPIVVRVHEGAPEIVSYDIIAPLGTNSTSCGESPGAFTLEASLDGMNWDLLEKYTNTADATQRMRLRKNNLCVMSDGRSYSKDRTGSDYVWDISPEIPGSASGTGSALDTVSSVRVDVGAVLSGIGDSVVVGSLEVEASGGGTLENVEIAEAGTLNVLGMGDRFALELPLTFTDVENLNNLSGWTVKLDGETAERLRVSVSGGCARIVRKGFIMYLR